MASRTPPNPNEIAIVTVHGTGDIATSVDGDKWFQNGSVFAERLKQRLAKQGINAAILPHLWSGANSAQGRESGARTLSRAIRGYAGQFGGVHVIGHSHGGNVANDAAAMIGWRLHKKRPQKISSIATVGTPFFKAQLGRAETFGARVFTVLTVISVLALAIAALTVFFMLPYQNQQAGQLHAQIEAATNTLHSMPNADAANEAKQSAAIAHERLNETEQYQKFLGVVATLLPFSAVALFFMVPLSIRGYLRAGRIRRKQIADAKIFSLWHPNDEAIAFLKRIEELPIEPFPRWALWRSSRATGTLYGVRAVLYSFVGAMLLILLSIPRIVTITDSTYEGLGKFLHYEGLVDIFRGLDGVELGIFLAIAIIFAGPLLFGAAYIITRIVRGFAFEMIGRGWLNTTISSVLRGMAFGRDSDERIGNISTASHTYGVRPFILDGEVAERMRAGASTSASALIEKYRWALFNVGPDTNDSVAQLAKDAMTWDSLIHTTYFDQPEVANVIGDYIAECVERDREALAARGT